MEREESTYIVHVEIRKTRHNDCSKTFEQELCTNPQSRIETRQEGEHTIHAHPCSPAIPSIF